MCWYAPSAFAAGNEDAMEEDDIIGGLFRDNFPPNVGEGTASRPCYDWTRMYGTTRVSDYPTGDAGKLMADLQAAGVRRPSGAKELSSDPPPLNQSKMASCYHEDLAQIVTPRDLPKIEPAPDPSGLSAPQGGLLTGPAHALAALRKLPEASPSSEQASPPPRLVQSDTGVVRKSLWDEASTSSSAMRSEAACDKASRRRVALPTIDGGGLRSARYSMAQSKGVTPVEDQVSVTVPVRSCSGYDEDPCGLWMVQDCMRSPQS